MTSSSLKSLAVRLHLDFRGDPNVVVSGVADLETATEVDASFLANPRYEAQAKNSRAAVIVVQKDFPLFEGKNFLLADDPSLAFQQLIELFYPPELFTEFVGIHPTAVVHPKAVLGPDVSLGPYVVVDSEAHIGPKTHIGANCYIGKKVTIGSDCTIYPHVVLRERTQIGNRVILQPGVVIGGCGFGFSTDKSGKHSKINQVGNVKIADDVEVGANTTIDRARFQSTSIGEGTKIGALVVIAHGVTIGRHTLIVSQTGIAGSVTIGNHVIIGGQAGLSGHLKICDYVAIAAQAGISKSISKPGKYGGTPAIPLNDYHRAMARLYNIEDLVQEVKALKKKIAELEKSD